MTLFLLFMGSIFLNNILLTNFLGLTSVLVVPDKKEVYYIELFIACMSLIITLVIYFAYHYLLKPYYFDYLIPLLAIVIVIILAMIAETIINKYFKHFKDQFGDYITLLFFSPVTLSIGLLAINKEYNLGETLLYTVGSSIGLLLIIYAYSHLKERFDIAPLNKSFRGIPIALITIGLMAMIFARYLGA